MNGFHTEWITVSEAAEWLNVSPQTIRNWIRLGLFRGRRLNPQGNIMVKVSDIEEAIDEGEIA